MKEYPNENFTEVIGTYNLKVNNHYIYIKNVPYKINNETGESVFSAEVLNKLMDLISTELEIDKNMYYDYEQINQTK